MARKKKPVEPEPSEVVKAQAQAETLHGAYCNLAFVRHTRNEFVIDFVLRLPEDSHLVSRVLTSPRHAKALVTALRDNVVKYEKRYGKIKVAATEQQRRKPARRTAIRKPNL